MIVPSATCHFSKPQELKNDVSERTLISLVDSVVIFDREPRGRVAAGSLHWLRVCIGFACRVLRLAKIDGNTGDMPNDLKALWDPHAV